MKTNATEFFTGISPLKGVSAMNGTHLANGRSGRCHCCPYGYHIDLDFVRYCEMVNQVSKNDNPTLRHLKKLKRQRRRQTQSMEVLLGLEPGEENATTTTTSITAATAAAATTAPQYLQNIQEFNSGSATSSTAATGHQFPRLQIIEDPQPISKEKERTPPPPPPRRSRTPGGGGGAGGPPPDVISPSRRAVSDALAAMNERNKKVGEGAGIERPHPPSMMLMRLCRKQFWTSRRCWRHRGRE
ncbi:hypothetical protein O3P69_009782 [Scylla paramamosain]|uniref:Uncharacterized protein n=1 Tax=Scylla paramamosain TaxID=85552 RepID=A0AAW0SMQ9_SCYPA